MQPENSGLSQRYEWRKRRSYWLQEQLIPNSEQNSLLVEGNGLSRNKQNDKQRNDGELVILYNIILRHNVNGTVLRNKRSLEKRSTRVS